MVGNVANELRAVGSAKFLVESLEGQGGIDGEVGRGIDLVQEEAGLPVLVTAGLRQLRELLVSEHEP